MLATPPKTYLFGLGRVIFCDFSSPAKVALSVEIPFYLKGPSPLGGPRDHVCAEMALRTKALHRSGPVNSRPPGSDTSAQILFILCYFPFFWALSVLVPCVLGGSSRLGALNSQGHLCAESSRSVLAPCTLGGLPLGGL